MEKRIFIALHSSMIRHMNLKGQILSIFLRAELQEQIDLLALTILAIAIRKHLPQLRTAYPSNPALFVLAKRMPQAACTAF